MVIENEILKKCILFELNSNKPELLCVNVSEWIKIHNTVQTK